MTSARLPSIVGVLNMIEPFGFFNANTMVAVDKSAGEPSLARMFVINLIVSPVNPKIMCVYLLI
jgi:hypothetical protein